MKKISSLLLFALFVCFISCKKDEEVSNEVKYTLQLAGANEVPANASAATGTFEGTYNKDTKVLTYKITYSGITPTAWHIHKAVKGVNGSVLFNFGTSFSSPFTGTSIQLNAAQEKALLADSMYVNIHSALFSGGEIRAQMVK